MTSGSNSGYRAEFLAGLRQAKRVRMAVTMKTRGSVALLVWCVSLTSRAADVNAPLEEVRNPIPMGIALKLGAYELTRLVDPFQSEAGQDEAANLYAQALRIKTDYGLALRDLHLVEDLDAWRELILKCRCGVWDIASAHFGGGTMWGHNSRREAADVEDFAAALAMRLPLAKGPGSREAARVIDRAIAHVNALKPDAEVMERYRETVRRVTKDWLGLKARVATLAPAEAERIALFAIGEAMDVEKAGMP